MISIASHPIEYERQELGKGLGRPVTTLNESDIKIFDGQLDKLRIQDG